MGWTPEQEQAIGLRGGSLLVSAAAGSGKTSVLVERIVQRITDENDPCDVDELLVVTFANDAAAEMKERVYNRLRAMLEENPGNARLQRQQLILPRAKICTIDSFFADVVRENAASLGVNADFRTVVGVQYDAYISQAITLALDEMYSHMPEGFSDLVELVSNGRDDRELEGTVKSVYNSVSAYPFPNKKLDELVAAYADCSDVANSRIGKFVYYHSKSGLEYALSLLEPLYREMSMEPELFAEYCSVLDKERTVIEQLVSMLDAGAPWDDVASKFKVLDFPQISDKGIRTNPLKKRGTQIRNEYSGIYNKLRDSFFFVTAAEFENDRKKSLPIVSALAETVKTFSRKLLEVLNEDNVLGFNDIQHLAITALCEGESEKDFTPVARELASRFKEIFVDECQDINDLQNLAFKAVSKNESNIFRVGDIKQSIYAFRKAMPGIFLGLREEYKPYTEGEFPAKVILGQNFRSGKSVIDTVNFCFGMLMSGEVGGIAYDDEDKLKWQQDYTTTRQSEFDIVTVPKGGKADCVQAEFIADKIESIMASGQKWTDKNGDTHDLKLSNFAILLRIAKGHVGNYIDVFKRRGINVVYESTGDFFACDEIRIMMSLLRVIDNPLLDVELMSVMFSPLYGFTPDDAVKIRLKGKYLSLYAAVSICATEGDDHCKRLVDDIKRYRLLAGTVTSDELIRRIYDETSFEALCRAMGDGDQRISNLMLLVTYAQDFECNGFKGLSAFVRYMEKLEQGEDKVSASCDNSSVEDAVRIMTIHKSKGLEFPYCFVAGLEVDYNRRPLNTGVLIHPQLGMGFDLRDVDELIGYCTLHRAAIRQAIIDDDMPEQLRVLYVALTRAKEKLMMVTATSNPKKLIEKCSGAVAGQKLDRYRVWSSNDPTVLLLSCLLSHERGGMVCNYASAFEMDNNNDGADVPFCINVIGVGNAATEDDDENGDDSNPTEIVISPELEDEITKRLNYEYKYLPLSRTVSKTTASSLKARAFNKEFFATDIPAFMLKTKMTAAQKGTAAHRFLECCDYSRCGDLKAEAARLVNEGRLTQEQADAINFRSLVSFFESDLFARLLKSDNVSREYNFAVNISACELYPDLPTEFADELIMVQGAVDCFFEEDGEIVIIDYKTDRVDDADELVVRYTDQLRLYRRAIEQITEKRVKECVLFSVSLGKTVEI